MPDICKLSIVSIVLSLNGLSKPIVEIKVRSLSITRLSFSSSKLLYFYQSKQSVPFEEGYLGGGESRIESGALAGCLALGSDSQLRVRHLIN